MQRTFVSRSAHRPLTCAIALVLATPAASAQTPPQAATLDRVIATAARLDGVSAFDTPASISVIPLDDDPDRAGIGVAERLDGVPGVLARERQNFAQDTQLSIRGFGARSTFGVRGVRLYADGIPATMPDGQGQVSHFNLLAADRIEVMRGPFSALYGNSSGGVVQIWSADPGEDGAHARVQASAGRDDTRTLGARMRGQIGELGYHLAASSFDTDGWRDHGAARRESVNLKLRVPVNPGASLTLVANHFDAPDAQDPLGLTRQQVRDDPRQAVAAAYDYDTRKSARQSQLGAVYESALGGGHTLRAMGYGGTRQVEQFLPVPVGAQLNPLHSGGVIDLDSDYGGADLRWSWRGTLVARPLELGAGLNSDRQRQRRKGFENQLDGRLGVRGRLRRDELNRVGNDDRYAQAWWQFAPRWSLLAGVRHSRVRFRSDDHYIAAGNPDDSGAVTYSATTPVAGLMFNPGERTRLYLSAGRGFETPTFNELGYRADGGAGLAFDLRPALSRNLELGGKWRGARGASVEAALFRADTDDELAVARNSGGRSSYRNVGGARRQGLEVAAGWPLSSAWRATVSYTYLDASFRDRFALCAAGTCATPNASVAAGTRLPGLPRQSLSAQLDWRRRAWSASLQLTALGDVSVDDRGGERAAGYALLDLDAAREWPVGTGRVRAFARIDNLLDRRPIGSVIVNESNGRYFEPGPGRGLTLGARWDWRD